MTITADTWAVVAATGLGPVLAVALTLGFTYWRETSGEKQSRRLAVFRTLMATRRVGISPDHVNAINLVEVDFYGCKAVEAEWKIYKNHLNDNSRPEDEAWRRTKEKLLSKLLFEIAKVLKFNIPAIDFSKADMHRAAGRIETCDTQGRSNSCTNCVKAKILCPYGLKG